MKMTLEKIVEDYLKNEVEKAGGRCLKMEPSFCVGIMDRLVLLPQGRMAFVETKRPKGGVTSVRQKYMRKVILELGFHVYSAKTKAEVDRVISRMTRDETRL